MFKYRWKQYSNLDCVLYDTDHYGGDIRLELFNKYNDCKKSCEQDSQCKRWTFRDRKNQGHCYLKAKTSNTLKSCRHCVTGLKNSGHVRCSKRGKY